MKLKEPIIQFLDDDEVKLVEDYRERIDTLSAIYIRKGFVFDGLSIPRVVWRAVGHPFQGLALPCGLIHDALYVSELVTRREADDIFYKLLVFNGINRVKAWSMWLAVRTFGGLAMRGRTEWARIEARKFVSLQKND